MIGRAAYHDPFAMAAWDARFFGAVPPGLDRDAIEAAMVRYMDACDDAAASPGRTSSRHMLGLRNGTPGARRWRQVWSDHRLHGQSPAEVSRLARAALAGALQYDAAEA